MRILLLTMSTYGGMVHYVSQLANALSQIPGLHIVVVGPTGLDTRHFTGQMKIRTTHLGNVLSEFLMGCLLPYRLLALLRLIKSENPDVIHINDPHISLALVLPLLKSRRVVTTIHDTHTHVGTRRVEKALASWFHQRYSSAIIVHGERGRAELIPGTTSHIIPLGNFGFFANYAGDGPEEENGVVLFFGRIEEYKGLEYLVEAVKSASAIVPGIRLVIAGSGDLSGYRNLLSSLPDIELHNSYIPDEDVHKYFRRAQVVVLPYIEATQSGIVPIAFAFGKPVVATDVGDISEIVQDEKNGLIVAPRDSKSLAEALVRLLKDSELRRTLGSNGYITANTKLSWESIARETYEVYNEGRQ